MTRSTARDPSGAHELGSAYRERLAVRPGLVLALKPHLLSLLDSGGDIVHLDLEGRLHRAWLGGDSYQRGLDGRVRRARVERAGPFRQLEVELADEPRALRVLDRVAALVRAAADALPAGAPPALAGPLARARSWDLARYRLEGERFRRIYQPIPILPPDMNRALVIQVTAGCAWNRCTFCHLYRETAFRLKPAAELQAHVREALELVGRALPLRRGLFLGQANALCIAQERLVPLLELLREELGRAAAAGAVDGGDALSSFSSFASFIDAFSAQKTATDLEELRELGLAGVTLGLESGSAEVLAGLGKPLEVPEAVELAAAARAAGLRLGTIVLVGAGGRRLARAHVAETVAAVARMSPGPGDRVYLSPLVVHPGMAYEERIRELGPLGPAELIEQAHAVRTGLRQAGVRAPIAFYHLRRFIY